MKLHVIVHGNGSQSYCEKKKSKKVEASVCIIGWWGQVAFGVFKILWAKSFFIVACNYLYHWTFKSMYAINPRPQIPISFLSQILDLPALLLFFSFSFATNPLNLIPSTLYTRIYCRRKASAPISYWYLCNFYDLYNYASLITYIIYAIL